MKIGFVGAGRMGSVLIRRLIESGHAPAENIFICASSDASRQANCERLGVQGCKDISELATSVDVLFLAFKPKHLATLSKADNDAIARSACLVSVLAGIPLDKLPGQNKVRLMPNTPSQIGLGTNTYCTQGQVPQEIIELLECFGEAIQINESQMDAATLLAGCGPAILFTFIQGLIESADKTLPETLRIKLATSMVCGSAQLASQSPLSLQDLIDEVAAPGSITGEALSVLDAQDGLRRLLEKAFSAANQKLSDIQK